MKTLAILFIGFSVFYALVLSVTHFRRQNYENQRAVQIIGVLLLVALSGLQIGHYSYLQSASDFIYSQYYSALLFSIAPAFYLFSRALLKADADYSLIHVMHILPLASVPFLSHNTAKLLAFTIGACYLIWLAISVYALREQRNRFHIELFLLAIVFITAVGVLVLGLGLPVLSEQSFIALYASAIGFAFLLIGIALSYAPQLSSEVVKAARETYAVSTLGSVNCSASLQELEKLMRERQLFRENNLDLHALASELDLSSHQLSELLNTKLDKSFSHYIREQRVTAAMKMLLKEPSVSVLSIGLTVGFTSQSNFYDAFREITGTTPGKYRKT
jgi:AraC-like DNA-binding protein